ncbi:MAG: mechanosensitive ion channel [Chromatiaceae bacterium]|nr:mechanosensitive ion channel [Gammaproteobacteria bacterium]MCB1861014.1 mechanosensitive ion channel [Gammaproteobacteria bacterium]MCB1882189.1 mechanosensitive ion channel [Gammaproteobacteria bacterium]MCB1902624.1 mechanosensitive ion channel [Gammaproteobacteria bacterium]MCP5446376.1 mechanosensitive ion channel [Chromatiaceae bacterium]
MINLNIQEIFSVYVIPWAINISLALVIFYFGRMVIGVVVKVLRKLLVKSRMDEILVNFISSIVKSLLLLFVIVAALDQLGVNTTSLIALLGAAGLAVGLALQGSLQNFAAGVMMIIFRPFKAGDYVEAGGTAGVVEAINIFSTTMRTGDNREIIVPNGSIYNGAITNYSARETRRIDMVFGISYGDDLRRARAIMQQVLDDDERVLKDPAYTVAVAELADSSVNFVVRPWVKNSDYWAVKFDLTEKIKLAFDDNGISIPFPQMDVHMQQAG